MATAALKISKLSVLNRIEACKQIVTNMTGNVNFPTPNPSLKTISAAIDQLETAYQLSTDGSKTQKELVKVYDKSLRTVMNQLLSYIQLTSDGDETIIRTVVSVADRGQKVTAIDKTSNVRCIAKGPGVMKVMWKGVKKHASYIVYLADATDPMNKAKWILSATPTVPRCVVSGLTSGTRYAFVVVVVGKFETSDPSDPGYGMAV